MLLWSLAAVFFGGLLGGELFRRLRLPPLLGMLLVGIAVGPHALGLLDQSLLDISDDLRKIALIIILTRAGLSLDLADLRKVGRAAIFGTAFARRQHAGSGYHWFGHCGGVSGSCCAAYASPHG